MKFKWLIIQKILKIKEKVNNLVVVLLVLKDRIFNRNNFTKLIIIFVVGFVSRTLINYYYDINVFVEYTSIISLVYYWWMSMFIVLIHEFVAYFEINIIPTFIIESWSYLLRLVFKSINFSWECSKSIYQVKINWKVLSLLKIKNGFMFYVNSLFNENKIVISGNDNSVLDSNKVKNIKISNTLFMSNGTNTSANSGDRRVDLGREGDNRQMVLRSSRNRPRISNSDKIDTHSLRGYGKRLTQPQKRLPDGRDYLNPEMFYKCRGKDFILFGIDDKSIIHPNAVTPVTNNEGGIVPPTPKMGGLTTPDGSMTPLFSDNNSSEEMIVNSHAGKKYYLSTTPYLGVGPYYPTEPIYPEGYLSINSGGSSNHSTVGDYESHRMSLDNQRRADKVVEGYNKKVGGLYVENELGYSTKEVVVKKSGIKGKVKLGFKFVGDILQIDRVESVYIKYTDIGKRKFYWKIWEKGRGNYETYQDFKKNWDPNTRIWSEIKKGIKSDISGEVQSLLRNNDPFGNRGTHLYPS